MSEEITRIDQIGIRDLTLEECLEEARRFAGWFGVPLTLEEDLFMAVLNSKVVVEDLVLNQRGVSEEYEHKFRYKGIVYRTYTPEQILGV